MTAREEILGKVRDRLPLAVDLPGPLQNAITYPDPAAQFGEVLAAVGGTCVSVADAAAADRHLQQLAAYSEATQRYSGVPGVGETNISREQISDPHQLDDVEFAVLPGELAVAENGAIWVATDDVLERTLYFLTQHLAIVVPAATLVNNMHDAYEQIDVTRCRFGAFVSGPSKTADIEQSLVIGAHGARSLTVYLVG